MFSNKVFNALDKTEKKRRLLEIAIVFLKLGALSFGGPAAHIALMDEEIVSKRKWLAREKFMDLLGATNLIPGPNSTELAIYLGFDRGGMAGLVIAGATFIIPAVVIVLVFAALYTHFGALPEVSGVLYGIKPVIMAIILQALYRLGRSVIKSKLAVLTVAAVVALSFFGIGEIPLLAAAGAVTMLIVNRDRIRTKLLSLSVLPVALAVPVAGSAGLASMPLHTIFLTFLKIGSVLYGSGYVLLAFLEAEFVQGFSVITNQQLIDAVAVGQFTPGPVFTTATFIGYLISGFPGAMLATIGIFLPSFVLVLLLNPLIPRLRKSTWVGGALDGVNVASLGLMAVVSVKLGIASLLDPFTIILFVIALAVIMRFKVNSAWAILAGGVLGFLYQFFF
jgi:chromate transporter